MVERMGEGVCRENWRKGWRGRLERGGGGGRVKLGLGIRDGTSWGKREEK